MIDPYRLLQVDPSADAEVIAAAYRRLARLHHPDLSRDPDAEQRMAELNAAWAILRDPERRAAYDRERQRGPLRAEQPGGNGRFFDPYLPGEVGHPGSGAPSSTTLTFGRYVGWSLSEVARVDAEYLEWLARAPVGRIYRREIVSLLEGLGRNIDGATGPSPTVTRKGASRDRRRGPLRLEGLGLRFRKKR